MVWVAWRKLQLEVVSKLDRSNANLCNFADQMQIYAILQSPTTGVLLLEQCPLFRLYYNVQVGKDPTRVTEIYK